MQIAKNIEDVRQKIINDEIDADELATFGIDAMFAGMQRPPGTPTTEWIKLMEFFAKDDQRALDRLCGLEDDFNRSRWGMACIAYIAGNSICTSETALAGGSLRSMSLEMIKNLDAENPEPDNAQINGAGNISLKSFQNDSLDAAYSRATKGVDKE